MTVASKGMPMKMPTDNTRHEARPGENIEGWWNAETCSEHKKASNVQCSGMVNVRILKRTSTRGRNNVTSIPSHRCHVFEVLIPVNKVDSEAQLMASKSVIAI